MARKFSVWTSTEVETDEITSLFVTDQTEEESEKDTKRRSTTETRPRVATFPVSQLYDFETQKRRAYMLADYLNKIQEITDQAISQNALIDVLSANPNP